MPTFLRSGITQWSGSCHVAADCYGIKSTIALHGYVTVGNMLNLSVPQCSHLENGNNSSSQLRGLFWELSKLIYMKSVVRGLAYGAYYTYSYFISPKCLGKRAVLLGTKPECALSCLTDARAGCALAGEGPQERGRPAGAGPLLAPGLRRAAEHRRRGTGAPRLLCLQMAPLKGGAGTHAG